MQSPYPGYQQMPGGLYLGCSPPVTAHVCHKAEMAQARQDVSSSITPVGVS